MFVLIDIGGGAGNFNARLGRDASSESESPGRLRGLM
jgi:hypothetical protein